MKAAVTHTFGRTLVEEMPMPTAGPGEAVIQVEACGVCSGEGLPWYVNRKVPTVLGHEVIGTVAEVGEGVDFPAMGDQVFVHHHVPCGECHFCRRGYETSCSLFRKTALDPGGYAEFLRVPRENLGRDTVKIPGEIHLEEAVFLEPIACSVRSFRKLALLPEESLLVIGLGVMGLLNLLLARRLGISRIIGSELIPERREIAEGFGVSAIVDPVHRDLSKEVRAVTEGRGADAVIVGPGTPDALRAGLEAAAPGGRVIQFTPTPRGEKIPVDGYRFYFDEMTLMASYSCGPEDTREALEILSSGDLPVRKLVTGRFDLDGVDEAMARIGQGGGHLKSIVFP